MFPIISLGPLTVQAGPLIILIGIWLGMIYSEHYVAGQPIDGHKLEGLFTVSAISGILGARLAFLLRYPTFWEASPFVWIMPDIHTLDLEGGIVFCILAGLIYGQRKKMALWPVLDALTPLFIVLTISISAANFASGNAFGAPTHLPWHINLWGAERHPVQLYEFICGLLIAFWLIPGTSRHQRWRTRFSQSDGTFFLLFVFLSLSTRIFLSPFRDDFHDTLTLQGVFWVLQIICLRILYQKY